MSLCTSSQVKTHLGISGSTYDTLIGRLIVQVEDLITAHTGIKTFDGDGNDVTISNEIVDSEGLPRIKVKYWPVTEVTSVEKRNSAWGWDTYTDEDVANMEIDDRNTIHTQYVVAGKAERNIRISYTCGYETDDVPEDLNLCAVLMIANLFSHRNSVGLTGQSVLGLQLGLSNEDHLFVKRTLKKYEQVIAL